MIELILAFKSWLNAFSGLMINGIVPFLTAWYLLSAVSSVASRAKSAGRNAILAAALVGVYSLGGADALSFVRSHIGIGATEPISQVIAADYGL